MLICFNNFLFMCYYNNFFMSPLFLLFSYLSEGDGILLLTDTFKASAVLPWQVRNHSYFTVARFVACYFLSFSLKLVTEKLSYKCISDPFIIHIFSFNSFNLMFLNVVFIHPHVLVFLTLISLRRLMFCFISTVRLCKSCFPWTMLGNWGLWLW